MTQLIYHVKDLTKVINKRVIVDVGDLEIRGGELFVIVGPNGAGKSTFLRLLHFLEEPTTGDIEFQGRPVSMPVPIEMRRSIGMVFQRPEFLDTNVLENVNYPLRLRKIRENGRVEDALTRLALTDFAQAHTSTLSGGELQRVALARLLVTQSNILLLDEPTANLDPYNAELIEDLIRELHREGATIVMVTHNIFQARRLAGRMGLMLNGQLVEVAPADTFFENPKDPRVKAFVDGEMVY